MTLKHIFEQIEQGSFSMECDEVVTYYFNLQDEINKQVSVSSFNQLMQMYALKDMLSLDEAQED